MTIGDNIKRYRKENKLTQKQLGKKIGKSKSSIEKYESNKVQPSLQILKNIAKALSIDTQQLINGGINNIYLSKKELTFIYELISVATNKFANENEINLKNKIEKAIKGDIENEDKHNTYC